MLSYLAGIFSREDETIWPAQKVSLPNKTLLDIIFKVHKHTVSKTSDILIVLLQDLNFKASLQNSFKKQQVVGIDNFK